MPKPPPPPAHVREAKSDLRRASKAAREALFEWMVLRDIHKSGITPDGVVPATLRMWTAEAALGTAAARWRSILAERAAMPVADRWDLAALERWAVALDKAGAP